MNKYAVAIWKTLWWCAKIIMIYLLFFQYFVTVFRSQNMYVLCTRRSPKNSTTFYLAAVSPVYSWFLFYVLYFTGVTHSFLQIWENLFPLPIPLLLNLLLCWSIFFIKNTTTLTRKINDFANRSYYSIEYPTIQHMPSLHLCIQHLQINDDNLLRQQSINHMVQIDLPSTTYSIIYQQASHLPFPHKLILNLMWVLKFDCSDVGLFFPLGFDVQGWFTEE